MKRLLSFGVIILFLSACGGSTDTVVMEEPVVSEDEVIGEPASVEEEAPAEPVAAVPKGDLVGVWVGTEGQPSLRFAEDGRFCLSIIRDELDTLPGDCGTYKVSEMSLVLTSDKYMCKGDVGSYEFEVTELGQLHFKVFDDECFERMINIDNVIFEPES